MLYSNFFVSIAVLVSKVVGQTSDYCDSITSICYQSYTDSNGISVRFALPQTNATPFDLVIQIVSPVQNKWVGLAFNGRMQYNPLLVAWPNNANIVASPRWATGYNRPQQYPSATLTTLKGTGANTTHWTLTVRCQGCSTWQGTDGSTQSLNPNGSQQFAWALSTNAVQDPSNPSSTFGIHDSHGSWTHNLASARNNKFDSWVLNNQLSTSSSLTTSAASTSSSSTAVVTSVSPTTQAGGSLIPTACPGISQPRYSGSIVTGWRAVKIAGGLTTPRMVIVDPSGRLLVVENGKGVSQHTLSTDGCILSSSTIIQQNNLNHGIAVTPDGKYLYASSMTTVWRWDYNSATGSAINPVVVIKDMSNRGHSSRTLAIPKNRGNLLVVSVGSDGNLDMPTQDAAVQRAVVRVFDMDKTPSGGYSYSTGGWQAGRGLRNEVALVFDADNNLWGAENSADNLYRTANGQTVDVHIDNPAEEVNFLGDVSRENTRWYGYPVCFTVWDPSVFKDRSFQTGDQFLMQPNGTFNDDTCGARSTPPRLSLQAHSAPLDASFDASNANLYISFHGSWNRPNPTGFKLVVAKFERGTNAQWEPVAAANSKNGYTDIFWNTDTSKCNSNYCFRPVGVTHDSTGRMFMTSDAPGEGELFIIGPANAVITPSSVATSATATTYPPSTTTKVPSPQQTKGGRCGGGAWRGPFTCVKGTRCRRYRRWYPQCL